MMIRFGDKVRIRCMPIPLLVVDIVTHKLVVVAWKGKTGKIYELIVSKMALEKVDA